MLRRGLPPSVVTFVNFGSQGDYCDPSSAADAGRASASQLLSEHRAVLYPCDRGLLEAFPSFTGSFGARPYPTVSSSSLRDRKFLAGTITSYLAALRFLYVKTRRRPYLPEHIPFPKIPRQLPAVLSPEEVERLIDSAENLMRRTMVMTLYATGIRCSELCHLKVSDIDSQRMVIHVHKGNGGGDRTMFY